MQNLFWIYFYALVLEVLLRSQIYAWNSISQIFIVLIWDLTHWFFPKVKIRLCCWSFAVDFQKRNIVFPKSQFGIWGHHFNDLVVFFFMKMFSVNFLWGNFNFIHIFGSILIKFWCWFLLIVIFSHFVSFTSWILDWSRYKSKILVQILYIECISFWY